MDNGGTKRQGVRGFFADLAQAIAEVYRKGGSMPLAAPLIFGLIVVAEFAQHVAEIQLGMFRSTAEFRSHAFHPLRMGFGGVKVAALVIVMLASARFWWCDRSVNRTFLMPPPDLGRVVLGMALIFLMGLPAEWIEAGPGFKIPVVVISWTLSFLLLAYLIGAVLGDRSMTLGRAVRQGWRFLPVLTVLLVAAYVPAFALHMGTHKLAIGAAPALVWALMTVDALVVGLLATLVGSAMAVAYARSGLARLSHSREATGS